MNKTKSNDNKYHRVYLKFYYVFSQQIFYVLLDPNALCFLIIIIMNRNPVVFKMACAAKKLTSFIHEYLQDCFSKLNFALYIEKYTLLSLNKQRFCLFVCVSVAKGCTNIIIKQIGISILLIFALFYFIYIIFVRIYICIQMYKKKPFVSFLLFCSFCFLLLPLLMFKHNLVSVVYCFGTTIFNVFFGKQITLYIYWVLISFDFVFPLIFSIC